MRGIHLGHVGGAPVWCELLSLMLRRAEGPSRSMRLRGRLHPSRRRLRRLLRMRRGEGSVRRREERRRFLSGSCGRTPSFSRRAFAPEVWQVALATGVRGVAPENARGTARRRSATSPSVHAAFGPRGASRRAVAASFRHGPRFRQGLEDLRRQPAPGGGSWCPRAAPRAARARVLRGHARGRRPDPHETAQPVRTPQGIGRGKAKPVRGARG